MKIQLDTGYPAPQCMTDSCPYTRECANHTTAGDFRTEDGRTPNLILEDENVFCDGTQDDSTIGAKVLHKGKLIPLREYVDYLDSL